jgi:Ca2+-binding EF-hand superfamily protein
MTSEPPATSGATLTRRYGSRRSLNSTSNVAATASAASSSAAATPEMSADEFRDVFSLYDRTGAGSVQPALLGDLLRAAGHNPTQAEVREIVAGLCGAPVDFATFQSAAAGFSAAGAAGARSPATHDEMLLGFQVFDKDMSGTLPSEDLVSVLTTVGESMTPAEVRELLAALEVAPREDGSIAYEDFLRALETA